MIMAMGLVVTILMMRIIAMTATTVIQKAKGRPRKALNRKKKLGRAKRQRVQVLKRKKKSARINHPEQNTKKE